MLDIIARDCETNANLNQWIEKNTIHICDKHFSDKQFYIWEFYVYIFIFYLCFRYAVWFVM